MANLHITEFSAIPKAPDGKPLFIAAMSSIVTTQVVSFTTTTKSAAFKSRTSFIRVYTDTKAFLEFGSDPTATNQSIPIGSNAPEYFAVKSGKKLAVHDGTS